MTKPIVLSYVQAETLLGARQHKQDRIEVSPDLGISTVTVQVSDTGVAFPGGVQLDWQQITKIKKETSNCFRVEDNTLSPIQTFSPQVGVWMSRFFRVPRCQPLFKLKKNWSAVCSSCSTIFWSAKG